MTRFILPATLLTFSLAPVLLAEDFELGAPYVCKGERVVVENCNTRGQCSGCIDDHS